MVVYLDHAATTPLRPQALEAMLPYLTEHFGNPSGSHAVARRAKEAIETARETVAAVLGCRPLEVVFTSGGTEADNLAITGSVRRRGGRPICSAVEHHAVLRPVERAEGCIVGVTSEGLVDPDRLAAALAAIGNEASVVSVIAANNETGAVQPIEELVATVRRTAPGVPFHTDAVQAAPWLDVAALCAACDLVSVSAHKFGGPKGIGALVVRSRSLLDPVLLGGGQENELRSGTHNVAGIVGMAAALAETSRTRAETESRVRALRDRLAASIAAEVPFALTSAGATRTPSILHVRFRGVESETLVALLDDAGVCVSAGSSCASGAVEPSHVLLAMGIDRREAAGALRVSLGAATTESDVDVAAKSIVAAVRGLRGD